MSASAEASAARAAQAVVLLFAAGFFVGWGVMRLGAGAASRDPAGGADGTPVTTADLEALARALEQVRADVQALRAAIPDAERQFFAGERARFRAALRRGRAQVAAWRADQRAEMQAVADRARDTIDAFVGRLEQLGDTDALAIWFDQYVATRQQWPPNQAWLLPELVWK